jgi:hypothetical protein
VKAHQLPNYVPACQKYKAKESANKQRPYTVRPVTKADYDQRDEILREIGFASYAEYLASDLWKSIYGRVMTRTRRVCMRCGRGARHVHHTKYTRENLLGHDRRTLWPVCTRCHRFFHNSLKDGQPRSRRRVRPATALPQESPQGSVGPATAVSPTGDGRESAAARP